MEHVRELFDRNRRGEAVGIYSVCASHPMVLEAAIVQTKRDDTCLLIESTANQVNQFGGYTGMRPKDFPAYVHSLAERLELSPDRIILGGDHLGPLCWVEHRAEVAMVKASDLIADYVRAGFQKIHLDTSMACAGDERPLAEDVIARRAAELCRVAETTAAELGLAHRPVYVIGTEVPAPGGSTEALDELAVTTADSVQTTFDSHHRAFEAAGLGEAWHRVIALVVQPGVEFSHTSIRHFDAALATDLRQAIDNMPRVVFEAHSTDFQRVEAYSSLIRNHFAILKVGPQLTFALREAFLALGAIEAELLGPEQSSRLRDECEAVMCRRPESWNKHYPPTDPSSRWLRLFSYSDRIRYYWSQPEIKLAVNQMMQNLAGVEIPLPLISQFMPTAYDAVCAEEISTDPHELVIYHIMRVTAAYAGACRPSA